MEITVPCFNNFTIFPQLIYNMFTNNSNIIDTTREECANICQQYINCSGFNHDILLEECQLLNNTFYNPRNFSNTYEFGRSFYMKTHQLCPDPLFYMSDLLIFGIIASIIASVCLCHCLHQRSNSMVRSPSRDRLIEEQVPPPYNGENEN
jgi:hypothetical protein